MRYTENNFNKKDNEYTNKIKFLKRSTMFAENEGNYNIDGTNSPEGNYNIDGTSYPVSTIWREVASTALALADLADWFDRYDKDGQNDNNEVVFVRKNSFEDGLDNE